MMAFTTPSTTLPADRLTVTRSWTLYWVTDMLAAVVLKELDWSQLPTSTPDAIRLLRCLKKDQRQRLQAIGDARISIDEVLTGAGKQERQPGLLANPRFQWLSFLPWALLILLAATFARLHFSRKATTKMATCYCGTLLPSRYSGSCDFPRRQHSGLRAQRKTVAANMKELEPKALEGTEDGTNPFWSPDSRSIGYFHKGELLRINRSPRSRDGRPGHGC